jgi:uncharacterized membrane protein
MSTLIRRAALSGARVKVAPARPRLVLGFDAEDRRVLLSMAIGAAVVIPGAAWLLGGIATTRPEQLRIVPDLTPLARATPMVLAHLGIALFTLWLGTLVLAMRKGTPLHKAAGRLWAGLMSGVAVTGVLVDPHRFTPAHGAALLVFWMIPMAIVQVRRGDLRGHRRTVARLLIALVIVAGLSLLPGHLLHGVFFQPSL